MNSIKRSKVFVCMVLMCAMMAMNVSAVFAAQVDPALQAAQAAQEAAAQAALQQAQAQQAAQEAALKAAQDAQAAAAQAALQQAALEQAARDAAVQAAQQAQAARVAALTGQAPAAVAGVPSSFALVKSIIINTATEQVIAMDANNKPIQVFACSTGARGNTTVGNYRTSDYYEWRLMMGNCYSRYAIRFNGGELIHSVPYYRHSPDSLEYRQYNRLGTPASAGCCRLALADAKWMYQNTVPGTPVQVVRDPNFIFPLTRGIIKINENDVLRRGWDPTDTDPANPYHAVPVAAQ